MNFYLKMEDSGFVEIKLRALCQKTYKFRKIILKLIHFEVSVNFEKRTYSYKV